MTNNETKQAVKVLESKGYHIVNMFDGFTSTLKDEWELLNNDGDVLMDHLTESHIMQLSKILQAVTQHTRNLPCVLFSTYKQRIRKKGENNGKRKIVFNR